MGHSVCVIGRNSQQPKSREYEEIPRMSRSLKLKISLQSMLVFRCVLLLAVITHNYNVVWVSTSVLVFLAGWQLADGGLSQGSLETQPFSMYLILLLYAELTVIGSLSSSLSYYISPFGYPVYPLGALHIASESHECPLCRTQRTSNPRVLMVTAIFLWPVLSLTLHNGPSQGFPEHNEALSGR